jgi:internalin A
LGGTLQRTMSGMRVGGGGVVSSSVFVDGGNLAVGAPGESLIIYGFDSLVRIIDGTVTAMGTFEVDPGLVHDTTPFLEFGPGGGTATFAGLDLGASGYINFTSSSGGQLTLTDGAIKDHLNAGADTWHELWDVARLRIDGANEGGFNNRFQVTVSGTARTLRLKPAAGPAPRFTSIDGFGGRVHTGLQVLSGFTDSNLISAIKRVGLNSLGLTSQVYDLDVAGLDELLLAGAGVAILQGVEGLTNVVFFDVRDNPIVDATPIEGMTQLQELNLQGTSFEDTALLSGLTNLVWLGLSDNQISALTGLSTLTGVDTFDLSGNFLTNLSALASVSHAATLDLTGNGITDLSGIEAMAGLEYLNLHGNSVSDVSPIGNLTSLTWLDLSANQISNVMPLATLTNLTWVGCSGNALTSTAGFGSAERIEWLGLQDNQIEDLSGLESLTNLTWLRIAGNSVSTLGELASLSNLRGLDLYDNNIDSLAGLENLTGLHWLDIGENNISDLTPLVSNAAMGGIGTGTVVYAGGNPLSKLALTNQIPLLSNIYGVVINPN